MSIGKRSNAYYLTEFLLNSDSWKVGSSLVYHALQLMLLLSLMGSIVLESEIFQAVLLATVLVNIVIYTTSKQKYDIHFSSLGEFVLLYQFAHWMEGQSNHKNLFLTDDLRKSIKSMKRMSGLVFHINARKQNSLTGDLAALINEYLWGILLIDVSLFNHMMKIISGKQKEVLDILFFAGEMDALIAAASFRSCLSEYCRPDFDCDHLKARELYHPLLKNPVRNDFVLNKKCVITGANASGKSTFMKAVSLNVILAQTIHTCSAKSFCLSPVLVCTCMSLRDDILSGESYYFREARYLKRMLDLVDSKKPVLIVIDEMLKGTNTKERVAASLAILAHISKTDCLCMAATHDNELTGQRGFCDRHFESSLQGKDIVFDYKIHEGPSIQSDAIALLASLGYPESIIKKAKENMYANW